MRTIRASEISTFLYCHRAWWYHKQGYESDNLGELARGRELHYRHGQAVYMAGCLRVVAIGLMLAAVVLLTVYLAEQFL